MRKMQISNLYFIDLITVSVTEINLSIDIINYYGNYTNIFPVVVIGNLADSLFY